MASCLAKIFFFLRSQSKPALHGMCSLYGYLETRVLSTPCNSSFAHPSFSPQPGTRNFRVILLSSLDGTNLSLKEIYDVAQMIKGQFTEIISRNSLYHYHISHLFNSVFYFTQQQERQRKGGKNPDSNEYSILMLRQKILYWKKI